MYVSDEVIFLQLHKTACTHVTRVLQAHLGGEVSLKHSPLTINPQDRLILGSVRNPWDWYVSLWAFGCMSKGSLFSQLTASRAKILMRSGRRSLRNLTNAWARFAITPDILTSDTGKWNDVYREAADPEDFRLWLKGILSKEGQVRISDDYSVLPLNEFCGLLTYRFVSLFSDQSAWTKQSGSITNHEKLESYFQKHCVVQRFVRNESVESDLLETLEMLGVKANDEYFRGDRTNSSSRKDVSFYYDEETIELVAHRDRFIIEQFGYAPPKIDIQANAV